jgi:rare lipoprotein A (peptidoglycan hydrolase)
MIHRGKHESKIHYANRLIWHAKTAIKFLKTNKRYVIITAGRSAYREQLRDHRWLVRYGKSLKPLPPRRKSYSLGSTSGAMLSGIATWYGPGFYGHSTSCGQILTTSSMWVASMTRGCGARVRICTHTCVETSVQDTGAFSATFDLAPGLARALGCYCTQSVRYVYH